MTNPTLGQNRSRGLIGIRVSVWLLTIKIAALLSERGKFYALINKSEAEFKVKLRKVCAL